MRLFARPEGDAVTVAEIAEAAGMTSAAVYYHFASKDDILLEGLRTVGEDLVSRARRLAEQIGSEGTGIGDVLVGVLLWCEERRADATVWFVATPGVSLTVEQLRRELHGELIAVLSRAARAARPGLPAAEAAVVATGLLSLIETAATSWLAEDATLTVLGRDGFLTEVSRLAERIGGV